MQSHLKTAHQFGVQQALKKCGFTSVEEVTKEAAALGLLTNQNPQAQQKTASPTGVFALLEAHLSR